MPTGQTDRQDYGRQTVTLRFPLDAANVIIGYVKHQFEVVSEHGY